MSLLQNSNAIPQLGGYNLTDSLRFRSSASAYLSRTPATASNRQTWTWSAWVKRGTLNSGTTQYTLFSNNSANTDAGYMSIHFRADALRISGFNTIWRTTSQVFRDPSAWYHIVVVWDTTQATAADRVKLYINGSQVTAFSTSNNPTLNATSGINANTVTYIGANVYSGTEYFDGYLTEVNFVDGQALDPTYFGEYNEDTGVWQPKKYTGTYGTNGFYLKGRGTDNSGNGNNWTENNFNTSNSALTTYDIMSDVPTLTDEDTANYCTLNPLRYGIYPGAAAVTLSEANLKATWSGDPGTLISTINIPTTGKWYWEAVVPTQTYNFFAVGVVKNQETTNLNNFAGTAGYAVYAYNGLKYILGTGSAYMASAAQNTVITVAFDADTGSLYVGAGGSWANGSGSTNQTFSTAAAVVTGLTGDISPAFSFNTGNFIVNFGQRPFAYTPPTGYKKLNTYNLPDSSIVDGSEYMNAVLYTGNGGTQSITGVGFSPDLVWSKVRNTTYSHILEDTVRGAGYRLNSDLTNAEALVSTSIQSFDSDGYTLGSSAGINENTRPFVSWNWRASDSSAVSNTDGTITSTVSANPTAGFSIVTYDSNPGGTVGHGLSQAPELIIEKKRDATSDWIVGFTIIDGSYDYMRLNTTAAAGASAVAAPTSTVFTPNMTSNSMIAYCFHSVEGYSKLGIYTGNGSADGPFVYTGFRPAFVIIKRTNLTSSWIMLDEDRALAGLDADNSDAENTAYDQSTIQFASNGFKNRNTFGSTNASGDNYIYMAFAENPFKNSLAR